MGEHTESLSACKQKMRLGCFSPVKINYSKMEFISTIMIVNFVRGQSTDNQTKIRLDPSKIDLHTSVYPYERI